LADFDVLIAGAGPAGAATALSLADFALELTVCLADRAAAQSLRVGETVPPQIKPILDHLNVWPRFEADRHCPSYRTVSAWGGPELLSNEFLFQTHQVGWRLDRGRFDAMMLDAARTRVSAHVAAKVADVAFSGTEWRVRCKDGTSRTARFLVDATGRGAVLARSQGMRARNLDRLVASVMLFDSAADDGEGLLIETFADGWWYTAALPEGRRIVACMSDADLARSLGLGRADGWMRALGETDHIRRAVAGSRPIGSPVLRPAGSRELAGDTALPLLCVGDAASCFDPVSGQGILKALRSGVFASYAIGDYLSRADDSGVRRYRKLAGGEFTSYRKTLRDYYAMEQRWRDRPFWRRRHAADESHDPAELPALREPASAPP
jgi:2-polyprenyl-6-methoxyphenol hydroxylase-like FAD-dependent oxidoreductase